MNKIVWDAIGEKTYETGSKYAVIYPTDATGAFGEGVAWNGITGITESPSGAEPTALWADDIKYANLVSAEEYGATIEAYTWPKEFEECDGSVEVADGVFIGQQDRKPFGLCYRTTIGNDTKSNAYGYKLHIVYNCLAAPSEKGYSTISDSPEAITFSWEVSTTPVDVTGHKPTATIVIDSTKTTAEKMQAIEDILYGSNGTMRYVEFTGDAFVAGTDYYERSGEGTSASPYVYTKTTDASYDSSKTYYTRENVGASNPRLPLPDEIIALMGTAADPGNG